MSAEKIFQEVQDIADLKTPQLTKVTSSGRVDINNLLARVRKEKRKENKINLIFIGMIIVIICIIGIILSF